MDPFNVLAFVISLFVINQAADAVTDAVGAIAQRRGITRAALGIVLVATFAGIPEFLVSMIASLQGELEISWGNIIGSNMANVGIMVGVASLFGTIQFRRRIAVRDGVFLLIITYASTALMLDGVVSRAEGLVLLLMFIPYVINLWDEEKETAQKEKREIINEVILELEYMGSFGPKIRTKHHFLALFVGFLFLAFGGYVLVSSAISIAKDLGIPEVIIGLTIVAVGTSVPDIAAAYSAAKKGLGNLTIAEIIGANIFSLLITLGGASVAVPMKININTVFTNTLGMCAITTVFVIAMFNGNKIDRKMGVLIFLLYAVMLAMQLLGITLTNPL